MTFNQDLFNQLSSINNYFYHLSLIYKYISNLIIQSLLGLILCDFQIEEYMRIINFGICLIIFLTIVDSIYSHFNIFLIQPQLQINNLTY